MAKLKWITKDEAFEYAVIGAAVAIFLIFMYGAGQHALLQP